MAGELSRFCDELEKRSDGAKGLKKPRLTGSAATSAELAERHILFVGAVLEAVYRAAGERDTIFCASAMDDLLADWASFPELLSSSAKNNKGLAQALKHGTSNDLDTLRHRIASISAASPSSPALCDSLHDCLWKACFPLAKSATTPLGRLLTPRSSRSRSSKAGASSRVHVESMDIAALMCQRDSLDVTTLSYLIHERLNYARGPSEVECNYARNVLQGGHPVSGDPISPFNNTDAFDIARHSNVYSTLVYHTFGHSSRTVTSREGISRLLCWQGSGQSLKTKLFARDRRWRTMSSATDCENLFAYAEKHKWDFCDTRCWGVPCDHMNPLRKEETFSSWSAERWSEALQDQWEAFLGPLLDCADLSQVPMDQKPTHSAVIAFLRSLDVRPFGSGLSSLQFANNLAILGVCQPPTVWSISSWIAEDGWKLGAVAGLCELGFYIPNAKHPVMRQAYVATAFQAVYDHLTHNLDDASRTSLHLNPIVVEHILCKVSRWPKAFKRHKLDLHHIASSHQSSDTYLVHRSITRAAVEAAWETIKPLFESDTALFMGLKGRPGKYWRDSINKSTHA